MKRKHTLIISALIVLAAAALSALDPALAATLYFGLAPHHAALGMAAIGALSPGEARVIDPIITEVVQGFIYPENIGNRLFPAVPVNVRGGQIISFGKEAFEQYNLRRAPGGATKRIELGYLGEKFALLEDSVEAKVPFEIMQDAERVPGINLSTQYLRTTMQIVSLALEFDQAALALDATAYNANNKVALSGTSKWSDATSTPNKDIDDYKEAIRTRVGVYPNTMVLSAQAYKAVRNNPNVIERFKYTSRDSITAEMLAHLWDLETVVIGKAVSYDANAGTMADVWGNNAVLAYVPQGPSSMQQPSYGYTYRMTGNPYAEEPYRERNAKSWIYPMTYERVPVITSADSAFLIQTPA